MTEPIRILLVDDSASDRALAIRALTGGPTHVIIQEAGTRAAFLDVLGKIAFDVIISDYNMQGFNGLDVISLVRERGLDTPIVLLTGTGTEEIAIEAMRQGVADYVIKTVDHIKRLPATLEHVLERVEAERARQRAEEELREQQLKLAHVARLSTVGEMVASVAHEINQPLYAIANFAAAGNRSLQSSGEEGREKALHWLNQIAEQAERTGKIVRRMRDFVRKAETEYVKLDLREVVRQSIELVAVEARHDQVRIEFEPGVPLSSVQADKIQLQQVLVNLLRNGFEAMADTPAEERQISVRIVEGPDGACVSVVDAGHGISAERMDKLFEAFFTTKDEGMGMGLAICNNIIEAHGGRIWATPNPDRGATFHFTLPLEEDR